MGISRFIYILLVLSIVVLFYEKEMKNNFVEKSITKPLVDFKDSIIYEISKDGVAKIIQLDNAYLFNEYQKANNVTILFKKNKDDIDNTLSAKFAKKVGDDIFLKGNVYLQRGDNFNLRTEDLQYNIVSKILTTNKEFVLKIDDNQFKGRGLFLDTKINKVITNDIHFRLRLKDTNETK